MANGCSLPFSRWSRDIGLYERGDETGYGHAGIGFKSETTGCSSVRYRSVPLFVSCWTGVLFVNRVLGVNHAFQEDAY
jgi:hypothetical protein